MLRIFFHSAFIFILPFAFLTACGYHFAPNLDSSEKETISVPYVEGDLTGELTAALVRQVSTSGIYGYSPSGGNYILAVKILDFRDQNIGFRYDQNEDNERLNTLIPSETRLGVLVEILLINGATGEICIGPARISANAEFDHNYYSSRDEQNVKSLGQLTDIDDARDAAKQPLYQSLAQKIVDYIRFAW